MFATPMLSSGPYSIVAAQATWVRDRRRVDCVFFFNFKVRSFLKNTKFHHYSVFFYCFTLCFLFSYLSCLNIFWFLIYLLYFSTGTPLLYISKIKFHHYYEIDFELTFYHLFCRPSLTFSALCFCLLFYILFVCFPIYLA